MPRIPDILYARYHQIKFWNFLHDPSLDTIDYTSISTRLPTFHVDSARAIGTLGPLAIGHYFSTMEWCVNATLMLFVVHQPTPIQRQVWANILKSKFPEDQIYCLDMNELIDFVDSLHTSRRNFLRGWVGPHVAIPHFDPLRIPEDEARAEDFNKYLVIRFMRRWMAACLPLLRLGFTTRQLLRVCRGFGQGRMGYRGIPNPGAPPIPSQSGVQEINYTPSGPFVPQ
jgi:hypothetical protein